MGCKWLSREAELRGVDGGEVDSSSSCGVILETEGRLEATGKELVYGSYLLTPIEDIPVNELRSLITL
jgi:hypothetical protein